jgi:hypothetical protein
LSCPDLSSFCKGIALANSSWGDKFSGKVFQPTGCIHYIDSTWVLIDSTDMQREISPSWNVAFSADPMGDFRTFTGIGITPSASLTVGARIDKVALEKWSVLLP